MGCAVHTGMGANVLGNILGINVSSPDFNPVDWWNAFVIDATPGPEGLPTLKQELTGTLSQSQKNQIINSEVTGMVTAGADPATALAQATSDVTKVLQANNADPSQDPSLAIPVWEWAVLGAAGLIGVLILTR